MATTIETLDGFSEHKQCSGKITNTANNFKLSKSPLEKAPITEDDGHIEIG